MKNRILVRPIFLRRLLYGTVILLCVIGVVAGIMLNWSVRYKPNMPVKWLLKTFFSFAPEISEHQVVESRNLVSITGGVNYDFVARLVLERDAAEALVKKTQVVRFYFGRIGDPLVYENRTQIGDIFDDILFTVKQNKMLAMRSDWWKLVSTGGYQKRVTRLSNKYNDRYNGITVLIPTNDLACGNPFITVYICGNRHNNK